MARERFVCPPPTRALRRVIGLLWANAIGLRVLGCGESPAAPVFVDGKKTVTLRGDNIAAEFQRIVDDYVETTYTRRAS